MKQLAVIIAPIVQYQIDQQVLYIAQDSIDNALAWENRVREAIEDIGKISGHAIDQQASSRFGYTVRKVVFERTYIIHYWIDESAGAVRVINFRHGTRLPRSGEP